MLRVFLVTHVSFFFFQAEDGIRDIGVTGVQTCALPISSASVLIRGPSCSPGDGPARPAVPRGPAPGGRAEAGPHPGRRTGRSEERRVGKEGRSRWSPYH